jgi:thymidylate kinase
LEVCSYIIKKEEFKMSKRGKLICLEGIDGSGKSTVASRVVNELVRNCNTAAVLTREPTNGPIGKLIREYLDGTRTAHDPYTIQMLMRADRLEHIADAGIGIRKMLDAGTHVICDRFMLSSVVYATYQSWPMVDLDLNDEDHPISETTMHKSYNEIYEEHKSFVQSVRLELNVNLNELISCSENDLINDMYTIQLLVSPDTAIERINKRSSETGETISIYEEKEKLLKLFNTYNVATQLLRGRGFNVIDVNAAKDEDEVYKEVLSHIKNIISL